MGLDGQRLCDLAEEANEAHERAQACFESGIAHAQRAGAALIKAKAQIDHGGWSAWLASNFNGSERTAQLYMRLVRRLPELDDETRNAVADSSLREAATLIAEPRTLRIEYSVPELRPPRCTIDFPNVEPSPLPVAGAGYPKGGHEPATASVSPSERDTVDARSSSHQIAAGAVLGHLEALIDQTRMCRPDDIANALASGSELTATDLEHLMSWLYDAAVELDRIAMDRSGKARIPVL